MDTRNLDTSARYDPAVEALISHFTRIDEAADTLPVFTAMPALRYGWASVKLTFALYGDLLLIVPINAVTLLRNIFPGHWRYTCWTCRYIKTIGAWILNGEVAVPLIHVRPVSTFFLHWHFRNRLAVVRRRLSSRPRFRKKTPRGPSRRSIALMRSGPRNCSGLSFLHGSFRSSDLQLRSPSCSFR